MDRTHQEARELTAKERRVWLAAEIHNAAHPKPVMDCEKCDARYLDDLTLDRVDEMLDESTEDARR